MSVRLDFYPDGTRSDGGVAFSRLPPVMILCSTAAPDRAGIRRPVHGGRPPALLPLRAQAVPHPGRCSGLRGDRAGPQPHQE